MKNYKRLCSRKQVDDLTFTLDNQISLLNNDKY